MLILSFCISECPTGPGSHVSCSSASILLLGNSICPVGGGGKAGVAASIPGTPCPRAERFTGPFAAIGMEQFVSSLLRAGALFTVALTGCCKQMGNGE